jgi:hypothetical protein
MRQMMLALNEQMLGKLLPEEALRTASSTYGGQLLPQMGDNLD